MSKIDTLHKLHLYKKNPNLIQEVSNQELADLVLGVLGSVNVIDKAIREGRLNAPPLIPDKDYMSKETALKVLTNALSDMVARVDSELGQKGSQLDKAVSEAITRLQNGKDGIVSEAEIERAAILAHSMVELPDVGTEITKNGEAIRDALELLQGDERIDASAIKGLEALVKTVYVDNSTHGTIGKNQVYKWIAQAVVDGTIPAGGSGSIEVTIPTGTVNGSNAVFTSTVHAKWIDTDTGRYYPSRGYTEAGTGPYTYTLDLAPNLYIYLVS